MGVFLPQHSYRGRGEILYRSSSGRISPLTLIYLISGRGEILLYSQQMWEMEPSIPEFLPKIAENRRESPKIAKNRRKFSANIFSERRNHEGLFPVRDFHATSDDVRFRCSMLDGKTLHCVHHVSPLTSDRIYSSMH